MVIAPAERETVRFFPGHTAAVRQVTLSFRVPGQLYRLDAPVGRQVEQDALVAQLDLRDFEIALRQIEARLDQSRAQLIILRRGAREQDIAALEARLRAARTAYMEASRHLRRNEELFAEGTIAQAALDRIRTEHATAQGNVESLEQELSKARVGARDEEIDAAEAQVRSLEAQRDDVRAARDDASLRSPFAGQITKRFVDNYQTVAAGQPIVTLQETGSLEVTVGISEDLRAQRQRFGEIVCRIEPFGEHLLKARISELGADADPQTRAYPMTVRFDVPADLDMVPGMTAEVRLSLLPPESGLAAGFVVPPQAIVKEYGRSPFVWIIDEHDWTVHRREITLGEASHKGFLISEGVAEGDRVVTAGAHYLSEGQQVRIANDTP